MQPPRYDLVVLDLDGTILEKDFPGGYTQRVRQTIAAVQAMGVPVTISLPRTFCCDCLCSRTNFRCSQHRG